MKLEEIVNLLMSNDIEAKLDNDKIYVKDNEHYIKVKSIIEGPWYIIVKIQGQVWTQYTTEIPKYMTDEEIDEYISNELNVGIAKEIYNINLGVAC